MNLSLDEIATHRARLRQEIMERECLLAAFDVVEKYAASGYGPKSIALGSLVSALTSAAPGNQAIEPPRPPAALPMPPPYIHPELDALSSNVERVRWAIARMTEDYSLEEIRKLLKREGYRMTGAQVSVVLTRMRRNGEVEEIKRSRGPIAARFRGPSCKTAEQTNPAEAIDETEQTVAATALA